MRIQPLILIISLLAISCKQSDQASELADNSIKAHGMDKLMGKEVAFSFRGRDYSVTRKENSYSYSRSFLKDSSRILDYLINSSKFLRIQNNDTLKVSEEWQSRYSNSINSVLYFFQIPFVLGDEGAIKKFVGKDKLNEKNYWLISVTFNEENGGKDYEDVFLYWINESTFLVDYLGYSYTTDGGGVRFREAIDRVEKQGITFQDYINYKAEKGTLLTDLSTLFDEGKLEKLSIIENHNIIVSHLD